MSLKHDLSKAYDQLEWHFLKAIMQKMGFREKWMKMMMLFVKSISNILYIN